MNDKIEQNKAQYDLDKQTTKISAYHQEMFLKIICFTSKKLARQSCSDQKI